MRLSTILSAIITLLLSFSLYANNCEEIRAAFDVGSGTTKLTVAKINTCLSQIGEVLLEKGVAIPFKSSLDNAPDGNFDSKIQAYGLEQIGKLKEEAATLGAKKFVAVATSAFRKARNGDEFAKRIERMLSIRFKVIDQRTEAILGHMAATQSTKKLGEDIIVWDIGGGSMQMTYLDKNQNYNIYEGKLASVSFKNMILAGIQGKNYSEVQSPNPLGRAGAKKALNLAEYYAKIHVPNEVKEATARMKVVGIGSLHNYSILKNVTQNTTSYTLAEVLKRLNEVKQKTDIQIGGEYASTDVSNLCLVAGFMTELKIEKVDVQNVNMGHGILTYASYWE